MNNSIVPHSEVHRHLINSKAEINRQNRTRTRTKKISGSEQVYILMWGSWHFDRVSNDEFSVEFWMLALIFFPADIKIRSEESTIHSKLSLLS